MATESCSIPVATLKTNPFEIEWGQHIWAKIVAINAYGTSLISEAGNGAQIISYPDAPVSLTEDFSYRTSSSVMLTWLDGSDYAGAAIISYQVVYDEASGTDFVVLEDSIAD